VYHPSCLIASDFHFVLCIGSGLLFGCVLLSLDILRSPQISKDNMPNHPLAGAIIVVSVAVAVSTILTSLFFQLNILNLPAGSNSSLRISPSPSHSRRRPSQARFSPTLSRRRDLATHTRTITTTL
jgi:hypothetical protein